MITDETSSRDERPALEDLAEPGEAPILPGCIRASSVFRKFANIAQAMDSENGPAPISELRA
jgi:hypothetical protein